MSLLRRGADHEGHGQQSDNGPVDLVRSEEELRVSQDRVEVGRVRARKVVETEQVSGVVQRGVEHADVERIAAEPDDDGQLLTLPDGSLSIPVLEEVLVVEKRTVVRERIIIRKHRTTEDHRVEAELRRERIEVETDPAIVDRVADRTT